MSSKNDAVITEAELVKELLAIPHAFTPKCRRPLTDAQRMAFEARRKAGISMRVFVPWYNKKFGADLTRSSAMNVERIMRGQDPL